MERLNRYQKIQIILCILIIVAFIIFVISIVKMKQVKNDTTEPTFVDMTSGLNENLEENVTIEEEETIDKEDTSWDEEAEDTKVEDTEEMEKSNGIQYYLKVNYTANVVTAYTKDNSGNYTVPVRAMVCSTGKATPTSGVYKMSNKYRWHQLNGGVYGQYCSRITGHILFHSVPYKTNSPDTLKYAAYDKLGTKASAGCIRLTVEDALWIYNNCVSGTYVEFYSSSNPGPLGKPTAQKISSNATCRNWDPTDPSAKNPWHGYTEPASTQTEEPKKEPESNNQQENQETKTDNSSSKTEDNMTTEKPQEPEKPIPDPIDPEKNENANNTSSENTGNETNENQTNNQNETENHVVVNESI